MKLFLDANVLVTVVNKEYPDFNACARVLSLTEIDFFKLYTSPICLSIAYYYAEKKHGTEMARKKIDLLLEKILVTDVGEIETKKVSLNKKIRDFEDGLQYYSALRSGCEAIITNNLKDYYFSEIDVFTAEDFLIQHFS